jgi:uncharacterized membrane protein
MPTPLTVKRRLKRALRGAREWAPWGIPTLYAGGALTAGIALVPMESRVFPGLSAAVSVSAATAIYSAVASGMIALTGIVFSLAFVMVQFSATAYSPRLVARIARDRVTSHAMGVFTATFLYAITAIAGVDRSGSGRVPFLSLWIVVILLVASVGMFIGLIQRIGVLQVSRVLILTGDEGRSAIAATYPALAPATPGLDHLRALPPTQTLVYHGPPRSVQCLDLEELVRLARASGGAIEMLVAVGDTLVEPMPVLQVHGGDNAIDDRLLWRSIETGGTRTFEQDPKYAIRLLVDIAIRALSPAINDPTTAVQALDQIQDLLVRLSRCDLEMGTFRDREGTVRLVVPFPQWDDFIRLSFDEICTYGATSVQVMRRMSALIADLIPAVPDTRRRALRDWGTRLTATIDRSFVAGEDRQEASIEDRQGLGVPSHAERVSGSGFTG